VFVLDCRILFGWAIVECDKMLLLSVQVSFELATAISTADFKPLKVLAE